MNPFSSFFRKKIIGIDIGTSAIKIVELSRMGDATILENYGELKMTATGEDSLNQKNNGTPSVEYLSLAIKEILRESRIKTKAVVFSIPDFSTFCTSFEIPAMTKEEIPNAILYSASQYITLPISEVTLDWQIIPNNPDDKNSSLKVFLVAMPNQIIEEYKAIALGAGLEIHALEAEVLGIARALVKDKKMTVCLIDIGAQSSTISIVDKGFVKMSYSFSFNSKQLEGKDAVANLKNLLEPLLLEIKNVTGEFLQKEKKEVQEIYLTGGGAKVTGLKEYFQENLKKNTTVPNCFFNVSHTPSLDGKLKEMAPSFSACVGVAVGVID